MNLTNVFEGVTKMMNNRRRRREEDNIDDTNGTHVYLLI